MALTQVDPGLLNSNAQYTGFKSRIINGAMMIDQRNAGASQSVPNGTGTYTLDRYRIFYDATSAVLTSQQVSTSPAGFNYSQKLTVSTAGTIGSGTNCTYMQYIEGYNFADLQWGTSNAKTATLSFWVYSSVTGTFSIAFADGSASLSYVTTYSITSANTWTQITVTVAGPTSGGTWATTNGTGLQIRWDLGCGSTVSTSSTNSWVSGTYYKATGSTSLITNSAATFYITGVQLEKGSTATSFDYRSYGTELALCQRYYQQYYGPGSGTVMLARNNAGAANQGPALNIFHKVPMRATPTGVIVGTWTVVNCAQPIFASGNNETATIYQNSTGAGDCYFMPVATTSGWTLSAEL